MKGLLVFVLLYAVGDVCCLCPHEIPGLKKWSDINTWGGKDLTSDSNVTITDRILLDTSTEVFGITIEAGAELIWSPNMDITLIAHYILVHGSMVIGSEDCPYPAHARISLIGSQDQYNISGFGEKFVGVAPGGTLEVHGKQKLSWTKLTKTLEKCEAGSCLFYKHQDKTIGEISYRHGGLVIIAYSLTTGLPYDYGMFRFDTGKQNKAQAVMDSVIIFLNEWGPSELMRYAPFTSLVASVPALPKDVVVTMAIQKSINMAIDYSDLYDALETFAYGVLNGKLLLRNYQQYGAWAMIVYPDDLGLTTESYKVSDVTVSLFLEKSNLKVTATSNVNTVKLSQSFVDFTTSDLALSTPILDLADDVSSWKPGDVIVVMSTDYDWTQAEIAQVIACQTCKGTQVRINRLYVRSIAKVIYGREKLRKKEKPESPSYMHYGEIYKNIDMRAEVALLSRNIKFEGSKDANGIFGGHVKILEEFESVHIEHAEFVNMGQENNLGRYPLNFYMCGDVDTTAYPPYIRSNSIHHTYARCIAVRATSGLSIEDNVCFDSRGHGYYLEDGAEKRTVFNGNLGAGQRKVSLIYSDKKMPVTFFITNPQTYMRNNVAAGGEFAGYWFLIPTEPIGDSTGLGFMNVNEAKHTAIYQFENNVAHSYPSTGLKIENRLNPDGSVSGGDAYDPTVDPNDPSSARKQVTISRFTGYKNRVCHASISGGYITIAESSFADAPTAAIFTRTSRYGQSLERSVIVGESPNHGEPSTVVIEGDSVTLNRSIPDTKNPQKPIRGFVFGADRNPLLQNWFGNFESNPNCVLSALGFEIEGNQVSVTSSVEEILYGFDDGNNGNRIFEGNNSVPGFTSTDADMVKSLKDVDGTTTLSPQTTVIQAIPFYLTNHCVKKMDSWGLAFCPHNYAEFTISGGSDVVATRDDDTSLQFNGNRFLVMKGFITSYIIHFKNQVPKSIKISGNGIEKQQGVRFGVCIPRDAIFDLKINQPKRLNKLRKWKKRSSLAELDADNSGQSYYFDADVGIVFIKMIHKFNLNNEDYGNCPRDICPLLIILVKGGDMTDSDCTGRAYPKYQRTFDYTPVSGYKSENSQRRDIYSDSGSSSIWSNPPPIWGAGATLRSDEEEVFSL